MNTQNLSLYKIASEYQFLFSQLYDHETGEMRGVLCQKCNQALGMLHDDAKVVDGLSEYRRTFL